MRRLVSLAFLPIVALALGCTAETSLAPAVSADRSAQENEHRSDVKKQVTVMSRNLYLGASLDPVFGATDLPTLFARAAAAWAQVQANDFHERAEALADEIAESEPALVGLQEVSLYQTRTLIDPTPRVAYDFLQILLDALHARGLEYDAVATSTNAAAELFALAPGQPPTAGTFVRLTDRDVILARRGVRTANPQHATYAAALNIVTVGGPISVTRGWTSVDVEAKGETFRFVNTHLENAVKPLQEAQAQELVALLAASSLPTILVGDLNSPADGSFTNSYASVLASGFSDPWSALHQRDPGFTCCQAENLRNPRSELDQRIDYVLLRGAIRPRDIFLVGEARRDRTASGMWPSDHAGVVAALKLEKERLASR